MKKTMLYLASLGVTAGSIFFFGDTLRLIAKWRVDAMDSIFVLQTALLAAVVFVYLAKEARESWPISILPARPKR